MTVMPGQHTGDLSLRNLKDPFVSAWAFAAAVESNQPHRVSISNQGGDMDGVGGGLHRTVSLPPQGAPDGPAGTSAPPAPGHQASAALTRSNSLPLQPSQRRASPSSGGPASSSEGSFHTPALSPRRSGALETLQRQRSAPTSAGSDSTSFFSAAGSEDPAPHGAAQNEDEIQPMRHSGPTEGLRQRGVQAGQTGDVSSCGPGPASIRTTGPHQPVVDAMSAALGKHLDADMLAKPDVQARLRANAGTLVGTGIRTPAQLQQFTKECHNHDLRCAAFGLGFTNNVGYAVGITAANEKLVSMLPPTILGNPALLGLIVGLGVGGLDVLCNVVGGKVAGDQMVNGSDGNGKLPASVPDHSQTVPGFLKSVARPTMLNIAKNATRLAAPHIAAAVNGGGLADRVWADRVDATFLDGGLGFVSNGANAVMALNDGQPYEARLLLREDLGDVIAKKNGGAGAAATQGLKSFGEGALSLIASPTPVAISATIGAFVGTLFAANSSIDTVGTAAAELMRGSAIPKELADPTMLVAKRASSTAFFGVMTGTLAVLPAALETFVTPKLQAGAKAAVDTMIATGAALPDVGRWALGLQRQQPNEPPV
jgi:hypothetical protein